MTAFGKMANGNQPRPPFAIGQVLVGDESGLQVSCNGQILTKEDIWINDQLLVGYSQKLVADLPGTCPHGGTMTPVTKDQLLRSEFALKKGDRVVLLSVDQQDYYLICKVVQL
nr:MAG TPA: Protein of unknown function (DUF2577) [Caudoviricetes sp.]